jgi:PTH1 family peptidyl-tRNA hydrolase
MTWIIVGLGNPGEEYADTRHNTGRMALEYAAKKFGVQEWKVHKATKATVAKATIGKSSVVLVLPDTFMNKSGSAVIKYVKSIKAAGRMVVISDDLDLPLGSIKLSYNRGSGGHKGVESVMRSIKTKQFTRIRIGVSRTTVRGKIKKPSGENEVIDFILTPFRSAEMIILKKVFKKVAEAIEVIVTEGPERAMNRFN